MSDLIENLKTILDNIITEEGTYNNIKLDYISNNITHEYDRLIIRAYNNLGTNNNLLIIARNPILHTKNNIEEKKQVNILDKLEIYYNQNIYDNILIMNIITNDDTKNLIIFKKIFELFPDIKILLCYGDKYLNEESKKKILLRKKSNKILIELDTIFTENKYYENQLIKCFSQTRSNNPYNIIQHIPNKQEVIDSIILNKNFNEYNNYKII